MQCHAIRCDMFLEDDNSSGCRDSVHKAVQRSLYPLGDIKSLSSASSCAV